MVIFGPIDQIGCLSACSTVTLRICFGRERAERAAGRGQDDAANVLAAAGAERLEDRVVLGIDRQHVGAGRGSSSHEQGAGAHQAFLVGERHGRAALGCGERRCEACGAGDGGHDPFSGTLRRLDQGFRAGRGFDTGARQFGLELGIGRLIGDRRKARTEFAREPRQGGRIAIGGHRFDGDNCPGRGARDPRCSNRSSRSRQGASPSWARRPLSASGRLSPPGVSASSKSSN